MRTVLSVICLVFLAAIGSFIYKSTGGVHIDTPLSALIATFIGCAIGTVVAAIICSGKVFFEIQVIGYGMGAAVVTVLACVFAYLGPSSNSLQPNDAAYIAVGLSFVSNILIGASLPYGSLFDRR